VFIPVVYFTLEDWSERLQERKQAKSGSTGELHPAGSAGD